MGLDQKPRAPRPLVLSHSLKAKVTQLKEIIARTADEWKRDGDHDSDCAGGGTATLDWGRVADAATDEFDETLAAVIAEPIVRPDAEFFNNEELDALWEIVANIINEELKGYMGEKITELIRQTIQRKIKAAIVESHR